MSAKSLLRALMTPSQRASSSWCSRGPASGWRNALGYAAGLSLGVVASWVRVSLARSFRIETGAAPFVIASLLLGIGLAAAAFCAWRLLGGAGGCSRQAIVRWGTLGSLVPLFAAPLTSSDFFHYLLTGRLHVLGKNPFATPLEAAAPDPLLALAADRYVHDTTSYGPLSNLCFGAAAWVGALVGAPTWGNAVAFKLLMGACVVAFVWLAARHIERHNPGEGGHLGVCIAAFCPLVAWEVAGQAHNDGLLIVCLMAFVAAVVEQRAVAAALAITAAFHVKLTMAPLLALYGIFLVRNKGRQSLLPALASAVLTAAVVLPYVRGFQGIEPTLAAVRGAPHSHSFGDLLFNVLAPLGPGVQTWSLRASLCVCAAVSALAFFRAARATSAPELLRGAMVFLFAWDMTIPTFQPWYVTWLVPFAVAERDPRWQRLVFAYAAWTALTWAAPIDPFTTAVLNGWVIWRMSKLRPVLALPAV